MSEKSIAEGMRERALKKQLNDTDFIVVTSFIIKLKDILINEYTLSLIDADNLINDRLKNVVYFGTHSGNPEALALLFMSMQPHN